MLMLPPRPKRKYHKIQSSQNLQFLIIKQLTDYLPQSSSKTLKVISNNVQRPVSSKVSADSRRSVVALTANKRLNSNKPKTSLQKNYSGQNSRSREIVQFCTSPNLPMPSTPSSLSTLTSKHWVLYQLNSGRIIGGLRVTKRIEVASLTKIMNLFTIQHLVDLYQLNPREIKFAVSEWAASMVGTSAGLKKRDVISLQDLMYAMMLPSGNDAAFQIALIGGTIIKLASLNKTSKIYDRFQSQAILNCRSNIIRFISLMNDLSIEIGMSRTNWANPHGLSNKQNKTTLQDMCLICSKAMQKSQIRKIVNTKRYKCQVQSYFSNYQLIQKQSENLRFEDNQNSRKQMISRVVQWENTNKMLWKGWNGIKTGVTPNAGPCLAASFEHKIFQNEDLMQGPAKFRAYNSRNRQYLMILANCASMNQRWEEVQKIRDWVLENQIN